MRNRKLTAMFLAAALAVSCTACSSGSSSGSKDSGQKESTKQENSGNSANEGGSSGTSAADVTINEPESYFADGDFKDVSSETPDATITLSGSEGTISDTTRGTSGSQVTIRSKGIYRITGSATDVSIVVEDDQKSGNIYLLFDNVTMENSSMACVDVESCDKLVIQYVGENNFSLTGSSSSNVDGAIFAKDDITINGSGSLNLKSAQHGIVCKNDLKITGAVINVTADSIGIQTKDSLRLGGGEVNIISGHDAIQVENEDDNSYFYMKDSTLTLDAGYDGISVKSQNDSTDAFSGFIRMESGTVNIAAGGGSDNSKDDSHSQKGIKCDGNILIEDVTLNVSSADDAIHGKASIGIKAGAIDLSSSDDGISTAELLKISDGNLTIAKSYEGLEAKDIVIDGGKISVTSSDDGINTAGGSDSTSNEAGPWGNVSTDASLTVNGGELYVNAAGDGLDSNGSLYVNGGTVIIEGPVREDNGALDIGDGQDCVARITGGVVLAIGSTRMAVNFNDGTQCSALVNLSGESGSKITVDDGSDFSFTTSKSFACVVYSSPSLKQGNTYTISADSNQASADFSSGLYYSDVQTMNGGGFPGGRTDVPDGQGMDRRDGGFQPETNENGEIMAPPAMENGKDFQPQTDENGNRMLPPDRGENGQKKKDGNSGNKRKENTSSDQFTGQEAMIQNPDQQQKEV